MTDLIQRIAAAIFRQEGRAPDYPNPGNLRAAPWILHATIEHGFWQPLSRAQGVAGAAHVIALDIARGYSLEQLISAWAPVSENPTAQYLANVKAWAEIPDETVPLQEYL